MTMHVCVGAIEVNAGDNPTQRRHVGHPAVPTKRAGEIPRFACMLQASSGLRLPEVRVGFEGGRVVAFSGAGGKIRGWFRVHRFERNCFENGHLQRRQKRAAI
jgi:hypothetical protein